MEVSDYVVDRYLGIDYDHFSDGEKMSWTAETGWRQAGMLPVARSDMFAA
jgi:hypothetical protein